MLVTLVMLMRCWQACDIDTLKGRLDCGSAAAARQMTEQNCTNASCAHAVVADFMCTALLMVVNM